MGIKHNFILVIEYLAQEFVANPQAGLAGFQEIANELEHE